MALLNFESLSKMKPIPRIITTKELNALLEFPLTAKELVFNAIVDNPGVHSNKIYAITGLSDSAVSNATTSLQTNSKVIRELGRGIGNGLSAYFYTKEAYSAKQAMNKVVGL